MNKTKIEWVKNPDGSQGYSWNPITGCLNGCSYCYARKLANTRLKERYLANECIAPVFNDLPDSLYNPFYPRFWEDRMYDVPIKNYEPNKHMGIFCCDMSDLFGIGVPEEWTRRVLTKIRTGGAWHRFYLLTKQPQNLIKFSPFPDNCWVGITTANQAAFNLAWNYMPFISAKVKYLSIEPMQSRILTTPGQLERFGLDWVIIGAQTKPYKPPKIEWVREIVDAADRAGIPVFLKDSLIPLIKPLMRVHNMSWFGNVFGLRQEMPK